MQITTQMRDGVRVISFSNPPVNALSIGAGLVSGLTEAVAAAIADSTVRAIVLDGGPRFSGGADIRDFDTAPEQLTVLRDLLTLIEAAPKPVVAAIAGLCLGGGLELALAAHYRVAHIDTRFALPEVGLGLLPGGGGTQRAPRLIGAAPALDLMLTGRTIGGDAALRLGLIDATTTEGAVLEAALAALAPGANAQPRPTGTRPAPADLAEALTAARAGLTPEQQAIIACVAMIGQGDLAAGLRFEAVEFATLLASDRSRALRHGFFGRRTVARVPGLRAAAAEIRRVTVIGGGLMGTGITTALLNAGLSVAIVEPDDARRAKAGAGIAKTIRRDAEKGRINAATAEERINRLTLAASIVEAAEAELFIEAVFEEIEVKRAVFAELDRVAPPGAILASNTSTLDLDVIAGFTQRPEQVVGLHFFSPANIMRLLEVVRGAATSDATLATAMGFAKAIGKTGVVAGVCDGFIGNRIFEEYLRQAWFLLEEGALPQQLDAALERFGMAMGPCKVMDLAGQDIGWNIRKRRAIEQPDRPYSRVPDLICELGRFGQKTCAGFYTYADGRTATPDPQVDALIVAHSAQISLPRREISDAEIVERCLLAMVNEGARIVGEGIALRPVDVDIVYLEGYGFPAGRGGPMFHADLVGLPEVLAAIRGYQGGRHGWAWEPAPLLEQLVTDARDFGALNQ